jgi:protein kinase A
MHRRPYLGKGRKEIRDDILARQAKISDSFTECSPECIDFINKVECCYIQMIQRKPRSRLGYNGINEIK